MKTKIILVLVCSCIGIHCMAQPGFLQKEIDRNGNISFVQLRTDTVPQPISQSAELLKNLYSARKTDEFKLSEIRKEIQDELGCTHQYYQQYYRNVKVEDGEATVHADRQGNIETITGYFQTVGDVDTEPRLSEMQALQYALEHIGAEVYKWQIPEEEQWIKEYFDDTYYPVGELVIVKDRLKTDRNYRLAYRFDIYAHRPMSRDYVWVDASTGDIIDMATRIQFANAIGTAATRYSGPQTITTDSYNGSFRLRATKNSVNISTFNMNHTGNYTSTDFTDNDNNWTAAEHQANNNNAGLDAHWGAEMTYEYFKQVHLRDSWNNSNGALLSYVNGNLPLIPRNPPYSNSNNAFWDGNKMTYGEGTTWPPVVALDICAHEIGHGIFMSEVNYTSSTGEFGAINESLSDIWGACVENWATTGKQTWLCGEDLGFVSRSMSRPDSLGQPDTYGVGYWVNINGCTPKDTNDYCGVHTNSGVMNYWFYLLSQGGNDTNGLGNAYRVAGVGISTAAKIVYRAETLYMTKNTDYAAARNATIQAATTLYGAASPEVVSVTNAWHAVGVGARYPNIITGPTHVSPGTSNTFIAHILEAVNWTYPIGTGLSYSANGNKITVTNTNPLNSCTPGPKELTLNETGWVRATLAGTSIFVEKEFTANRIPVKSLDLPSSASYLEPFIMSVSAETFGNPNQVTWTVSPSSSADCYPYGNPTHVGFCQSNSYLVTATYTNPCGVCSKSQYISVTITYPITAPCNIPYQSPPPPPGGSEEEWADVLAVYPNPASSQLSIEIMEDSELSASGAAPRYTVKIVDVYGITLYTGQQNGRTFDISVASLNDGIYYLIISDGITVMQKKLVIKH